MKTSVVNSFRSKQTAAHKFLTDSLDFLRFNILLQRTRLEPELSQFKLDPFGRLDK